MGCYNFGKPHKYVTTPIRNEKNKTNYSTNALQSLFPHRREGPVAPTCSGKRKFEDRMTLSEAKADDFTDTKDYVDFIQAKLKNVNIKIIK